MTSIPLSRKDWFVRVLFWPHPLSTPWRTRILWGVAGLATFLVLTQVVLSWYGARALRQAEDGLRAAGEPLRVEELLPAPGPDDQNVAAAPLFAELQGPLYRESRLWKCGVDFPAKPFRPAIASAVLGESADLAGWTAVLGGQAGGASPAEGLLAALAPREAVLRELADALDRPETCWPSETQGLDEGTFGYSLASQRVGRILSLRASAEIQAGRPAEAFRDVALLLRLAGAVRSGGFLPAFLVADSIDMQAAGVAWEGLRKHAWNDLELCRLGGLLEWEPVLPALRRCFQLERIAAYPGVMERIALECRPVPLLGFYHGWFDGDRAFVIGTMQRDLIEPLRAEGGRPDPDALRRGVGRLERDAAWSERLPRRALYPLSPLLLRAFLKVPGGALATGAYLGEAATACALERFRLANGTAPATLDALVPAFLPRLPLDPMTGRPFSYRRDGDGFLLVSLGWDGNDDGGAVDRRNRLDGDWTWASRPDLYKFLPEKRP